MEGDKATEQGLKARLAAERSAARRRGKKRVRFSLAVRREAVELAAASGRSREAFALDLGLSKTALQRWVKSSQYRAGFHHVKVEEPRTEPAAELVLVFPSGARLIGVSWEHVRQLLGVST
jgi:transposase-like protein